MSSEDKTILESFGHTSEGFDCAGCDQRRRYYDMLSDNTLLCLECSAKGNYDHDVNVAIHKRDPELMFRDPELSAIRTELVKWELENTDLVSVGDVSLPADLALAVLDIHEKDGGSVNAIIASGLRMFVQAYALSEKPLYTLPEEAKDVGEQE